MWKFDLVVGAVAVFLLAIGIPSHEYLLLTVDILMLLVYAYGVHRQHRKRK